MGPTSLATEAQKNAFKGLLQGILKNFQGTPTEDPKKTSTGLLWGPLTPPLLPSILLP